MMNADHLIELGVLVKVPAPTYFEGIVVLGSFDPRERSVEVFFETSEDIGSRLRLPLPKFRGEPTIVISENATPKVIVRRRVIECEIDQCAKCDEWKIVAMEPWLIA